MCASRRCMMLAACIFILLFERKKKLFYWFSFQYILTWPPRFYQQKDPIVSAQMIPMAKYLSYIALPKFCIGNPILCIFPSFYCSSTHASHWCKFPYSSLSYFGCCGHLPSNLHKIFVTNIHCHFFQLNYTTTISNLFSCFFLLPSPINSFFYEIGISLLNELTMLNGRQIRDLTSSRWCQHLIPSKARLLRLLGIILACHISAKKRLLFYVTTLRHKTEDVSADFQKMAKIATRLFLRVHWQMVRIFAWKYYKTLKD